MTDSLPAPDSTDSPDGMTAPVEVDVGSWSRFTASLADFLDHGGGGPEGPASRAADDPEAASTHGGLRIVLSSPAPLLPAGPLPAPTGLRGLVRRGPRRRASPQAPRVRVVRRTQHVEMTAPLLDGAGRVLLDDGAAAAFTALKWTRTKTTVSRQAPDGAEAAAALTRVLIEVLRVAHPADLVWDPAGARPRAVDEQAAAHRPPDAAQEGTGSART